MLTEITLAGYGPIKEEITIRPTPLHALIGPNDSGKSSILNATILASQQIQPTGLVRDVGTVRLGLSAGAAGFWVARNEKHGWISSGPTNDPSVRRIFLFRPWAARLKEPSPLLPENSIPSLLTTGGAGLPGVYDLMLGQLDGKVEAISAEVSRLFPSISRIGLNPINGTQKELVAYLRDGSRVPAHSLSDGIVFFLAFAALRYTTGIKTILLEEPENGLHPSRIRDVMKVLRETSKAGIQIILTTHSPLVLNEMKPEEVTVVTRHPEKGTQVTPLAATPFFKDRSEIMSLGELWLANCDGISEESLLRGVEP